MSNISLKEAIRRQRENLTAQLGETMHDLAIECASRMGSREALEEILAAALRKMRYCKHLYVLDEKGLQITDNITVEGPDPAHYRRDRSSRPYMQNIIGSTDFKLSEAYISRNNKRPSLTAVQVIRSTEGIHIGFLGADFDLRELPATEELYQEPRDWRQIKGDPAIRGGLFAQQRIDSAMDGNLDTVFPMMSELMINHGVFHGKFHFSSSRATIWLADNPFVYRILNFDDLIDPDTCLAYPRRSLVECAIVSPDKIMPVFDLFRELRFADNNIYLRSGSLNLCNGLVALNFSCDGTHYLRYEEFLEKGLDFWLGTLFEA